MAQKLPPEAFSFYLSLGAQRSYEAVAERFRCTKRAVTKCAAREGWHRRAGEMERRAMESAERKAQESLEQMNDRHLKSLRVIQGKALEALRSLPLSSAMEAVRALDLSIKGERVIRGEPGDRTALSVEEMIKREYTRWLEPEGGREPPEGQGSGESEEEWER